MEEYRDLNMVILGASFAGISAAHHLLRNAIRELKEDNENFSYRVLLVSPSTHIYWNISGPRAIVSEKLIPHSKNFIPIEEGFKDYDPKIYEFVQGEAIAVDTRASTVTLECPLVFDPDQDDHNVVYNEPDRTSAYSGASRKIAGTHQRVVKYHALVIATGTTAHSPLFSLQGPHEKTRSLIDAFHAKLPAARTIIIAGGGPTGIETAGQIAYFYNLPLGPDTASPTLLARFASLLKAKREARGPYSKNIMLLVSTSGLLPRLAPILGEQATNQLKSLGVRVITGVRVDSAFECGGKTTIKLSNGKTLLCDIYIPCTGVNPNTQFLSAELLSEEGYITTATDDDDNSTLRVAIPNTLLPDKVMTIDPNSLKTTHISPSTTTPTTNPASHDLSSRITLPRVYAAGDVADYSEQCVLDVYASMATLERNLLLDLKAYQLATSNPYGGNDEAILKLHAQSLAYVRDPRDSQLCPIGARRPGGVGVIHGRVLPSWLVYVMKGRHYTTDHASTVVKQGVSPYPIQNVDIKRSDDHKAKSKVWYE